MERYNASEFDDLLPPEPEAPAVGEPFALPDLIPAHAPGRNETLWRYGRSLKAKRWKLGRILGELERVNAERCVPPLPADELSEIAHNIFAEADRPTFTARQNGKHADHPALERPLIPVSGDLATMTPAAWRALTAANSPPTLFVRGAALPVRLEMTAGAAVTRVLNPDRMRHALARASRWERTERTKKGMRQLETLPPIAVVLDLLATPAPPLPGLDRIVMAPTFTPSGRLRLTPGYDPDERTYFAPPAG